MGNFARISGRYFRVILVIVMAFWSSVTHAQHGWSVDSGDYENDGEVNAGVVFEGVDVTTGSLGAFVGNECRGFSDRIRYSETADRYYFRVKVYSNEVSGEIITFQYYDGESFYDIAETVEFREDMRVGNSANPAIFNAVTNTAPVVVNPLPDLELDEYFETETVDLTGVFSDPDGDEMTYGAVSSNTNVVTVSISGITLTITEAGLGLSTITVTASDGLLSTNDQFTFTINNINDEPEVVRPIGNRSYDESFTSVTINLSSRFSDPDGDVLTFTAVSSNTNVVTVSLSGTTLTITEVGMGISTITVTASDGSLSVEEQFSIKVIDINAAPELTEPIPDQNMVDNIGSAELDLDTHFSDPYGDLLVYSVVLRNTGIVSYELDQSLLLLTPVNSVRW